MSTLAGKTIFISGGSRGIGLAIAKRVAADGANVALIAKTAEPHPRLPGTVYTAAEEIEAVGGHLNAYTSRENTAYYAKVMKDDVPLALDLLADILQHSVFDAEELDRERAVVMQEIAQFPSPMVASR